MSLSVTVYHGVPQGSILRPLLFAVYINDINLFYECDYIHLFVDDTFVSVNLQESVIKINHSTDSCHRF